MNEFNILDNRIEGTTLIEASAGTGKTYTITGLYLRLLLDLHLSVSEILVVTFTEAATSELKDRIRNKLRRCLRALSGEDHDDEFLRELVRRQENTEAAQEILKEALRTFDQAAIFTIHGFCKRMLSEHAFESGSLFDTDLIEDQTDLIKEIIHDFWRRHFYRASPLFTRYAMDQGFGPEDMLGMILGWGLRSDLTVIPQVEMEDSSAVEKEYMDSFRIVQSAWRASRDQVQAILSGDKGLNRNRYRVHSIPTWIQAMDSYTATDGTSPIIFEAFKKFTACEVERSVKKGQTPPSHDLFHHCQRLLESYEALASVYGMKILALRIELIRYARHQLQRQKKQRNIQSFDDLLTRLRTALEDESGEALARAIRVKFKAALIDEFQDTDPVQYAIFDRVFGRGRALLFLIGDPKQAIYGFRGADVFTYLKAARDTEHRYTLSENWRSAPKLITAVNTIFSGTNNPFVYNDIQFQPAVPARKTYGSTKDEEWWDEPPVKLWFLDAAATMESGTAVTKGRAYELIPGAVAAEISRLLTAGTAGNLKIEGKPLREEDVAILVRTNREARMMQRALTVLGIPSVLYSMDNLFDSPEAMEIERILCAIAEPNDEKIIRSALATDILGVDGEELDGMQEDEAAWERRLLAFREYHTLWVGKGFISMFRHFLFREQVMPRLMDYPVGERRNTNLLHLSEILHRISMEKKLSMTGLIQWLSEQRNRGSRRVREYELRLESDDNAVKVVTVHRSKGLEYPVVFCPFAWYGSSMNKSDGPCVFHDPRNRDVLTLDLGSDYLADNRLCAQREDLAENLRLFYVALTRAKYRCYLVWGHFKGGETSAPAYLLRHEERSEMTETDVIAAVQDLRERASETVAILPLPVEEGNELSKVSARRDELKSRHFVGTVDSEWRISSFSSLVSAHPHGSELADYDAVTMYDYYDRFYPEEERKEEMTSIFSFPRGARAGSFLHDVFEHLDFTTGDAPATKKLVDGKLAEYGFDVGWSDTVCTTIQNVLTAHIDPVERELRLSQITKHQRLNELEFYFPLKRIEPRTLNDMIRRHAGMTGVMDVPERIGQLQFAPARGFMRGFIDLVFTFRGRYFLLDWKSNYLGSRVENYDEDSLTAAMKEHYYVLQYLIYTVALHRYLQLRIPDYDYDRHMGGIFYIFLRGVDPDRGAQYGIYRARPSVQTIEELCQSLIDEEGGQRYRDT